MNICDKKLFILWQEWLYEDRLVALERAKFHRWALEKYGLMFSPHFSKVSIKDEGKVLIYMLKHGK